MFVIRNNDGYEGIKNTESKKTSVYLHVLRDSVLKKQRLPYHSFRFSIFAPEKHFWHDPLLS